MSRLVRLQLRIVRLERKLGRLRRREDSAFRAFRRLVDAEEAMANIAG